MADLPKCSVCGKIDYEGEMQECEGCSELYCTDCGNGTLCEQCQNYCTNCETEMSEDEEITCDKCGKIGCECCMSKCKICNEYFCENCVSEIDEECCEVCL